MRVCRKHVFSQPSGFVHTGRSPALNTNIIGSSLVAVAGAIALNTNIIGASRSLPDVKFSYWGGQLDQGAPTTKDISTCNLGPKLEDPLYFMNTILRSSFSVIKSTSTSTNPLSQRPPPNVRSELAETNRWLHATLCSPLLLVISN